MIKLRYARRTYARTTRQSHASIARARAPRLDRFPRASSSSFTHLRLRRRRLDAERVVQTRVRRITFHRRHRTDRLLVRRPSSCVVCRHSRRPRSRGWAKSERYGKKGVFAMRHRRDAERDRSARRAACRRRAGRSRRARGRARVVVVVDRHSSSRSIDRKKERNIERTNDAIAVPSGARSNGARAGRRRVRASRRPRAGRRRSRDIGSSSTSFIHSFRHVFTSSRLASWRRRRTRRTRWIVTTAAWTRNVHR